MAIDWTAGMRQTYELVSIYPDTWTEGRAAAGLEACEITREDSDLRVSVTATVGERIDSGYWRVYLIAEQSGARERVALATFMVTACGKSANGKRNSWDIEGYSPLYELSVDCPPIGWASSGAATSAALAAASAHCRAPVSCALTGGTSTTWVASDDETWLDVVEGLLAIDSRHLEVDGYGRVLIVPDVDAAGASPAYTFTDSAASVLLPEATETDDLADVPNTVEVVLSTDDGCISATAVNADPASASSTVSRGYTHLYRDTDPDLAETADEAAVQAYADALLASLGVQTRTVEYSHGFVPSVDVGDCVRIEYARAGISTKAMVTAQTIECATGCSVEETAEYEAQA